MPAGLKCEDRRLRIQSLNGRAVRFALLPHLKPALVPSEDTRFSVALLALEYTNADPSTGRYPKQVDGSMPPLRWRVGYLKLSPFEFGRLRQFAKGTDYESLYGFDLAMFADFNPHDAYFAIKNIESPCWTRDPEVAKTVNKAAQQFAENGGAKLLERLGPHSALQDWGVLATRRWGLGDGAV